MNNLGWVYLSTSSAGANGKLGTNAMQGGSQAWASGRHHTDLVNCFSLYSLAVLGQIRLQIHIKYEYKYNMNTNTIYWSVYTDWLSGRHHTNKTLT